MHIRPTASADIYDVSILADLAFQDEEFWRWLTPGMYNYPNDRTRFYRLRTRGRAVTKGGCISLVAVTDDSDPEWSGREEIVGYAFWKRQGTSEQAKKWQKEPWGSILERNLLWVELQYERLINRAVDFKRWDNMITAFGSLQSQTDFPEQWHCTVLGVSPKYRRRGIGSLLLNWGLEKAREEGVPAVLEATPAGVALYEKTGFKPVLEVGPEDTPEYFLTIMIWEPEELQGQWLTEEAIQRSRDRLREAPVVIRT
ncbi:acyl-CoA N-acyltransferase [Viridothelium virens]|uniref:Acyl-CoA N-acyltransferase n=1 Tax=Viridothelium virens TaxID=1048519 RepID=A0A6A6H084_VIRVR|nr:acyl-CoA N-acyltransferase [Viridothelium virens]